MFDDDDDKHLDVWKVLYTYAYLLKVIESIHVLAVRIHRNRDCVAVVRRYYSIAKDLRGTNCAEIVFIIK